MKSGILMYSGWNLSQATKRSRYLTNVVTFIKSCWWWATAKCTYKWEHLDNIRAGAFCIFNQHFFHQFGNLTQYEVFQPNGTHIFELSDEQVSDISAVYERIFKEINSDYVHKYDVLRNLVFELIHFALKLQPTAVLSKQTVNASQRISTLFLELLERQYPIDEHHQTVSLRSASDFAKQLNIHVNHLNRAVRETTEKTTTQIIAERTLQEAKILVKHSTWTVSEIAWALGFTEVSHFNNFFKKHTQLSPLKFRNI
jgi:AraC family transcriptional regulator, transcriptional activator of pobA